MSPRHALGIVDDLLGCTVTAELLATEEQFAPMRGLSCPITVAWSQHDKVFPPRINGAVAVDRLPQARFVVVPGAGHVPMIDHPDAVSRVILATTGALPDDNADAREQLTSTA